MTVAEYRAAMSDLVARAHRMADAHRWELGDELVACYDRRQIVRLETESVTLAEWLATDAADGGVTVGDVIARDIRETIVCVEAKFAGSRAIA